MAAENPLRCPRCHLCNLIKTPLGEWKCPHCGDPYLKSSLHSYSPHITESEHMLHQAMRGDLQTINRLIGLLNISDEEIAQKSADILKRSIVHSASPLIQFFSIIVKDNTNLHQRDRILKL
jgi:hypothetical protein